MKNSRGGSAVRNGKRYALCAPSRNSDPSRGCEGKQRFKTYGAAERTAKMVRDFKNGKTGAYKCRNCHGFHVGNNNIKHKSVRRSYEIRTGLMEIEDEGWTQAATDD
jgi:hypothetical protein